jgi:mRNA (guanine-N7-)-methyltransferase
MEAPEDDENFSLIGKRSEAENSKKNSKKEKKAKSGSEEKVEKTSKRERKKKLKIMNVLIQEEHEYFDSKRDMGNAGRMASRVSFLRQFNNWIKAILIKQYCRKNYSVLDLCCGKGGDLGKWLLSRIGLYVGADIAHQSVLHAKQRYDQKKIFPAIFITADLGHPNQLIHDTLHNQQNIMFNIVSCQMSMHYFFKTEQTLRTFLKNVTDRLAGGGYFIGSIPDSNVLVRKLRKTRQKQLPGRVNEKEIFTFGNQFYSVKFAQKRFRSNRPFGIEYYFYLEDSVGKEDENGQITYVPEYLILFDNFVQIAKEYGLEFIMKENFHSFYANNREQYRHLFHKIVKDFGSANNDDQWDISSLYCIFAMRKIGNNSHPLGSCGVTHKGLLLPEEDAW